MNSSLETRILRVRDLQIGGGHPIAIQSMTATRTSDIEATAAQVEDLRRAGADLVRVAVDTRKDAAALAQIRRLTTARLSVDLQENYPLAEEVAPFVDKIRYNPGHLHHKAPDRSIAQKVRWLVEIARRNRLALRVGVNCGSIAPEFLDRHGGDLLGAMVASAIHHCELLDELGFENYCVSLKDSDPAKVIAANLRFHELRPEVPLHLGVTEAGMPPEGEIKTRLAFEQLLARGIGATLRVSLTLPNERKGEEIEAGRRILADVAAGRFRSVPAGFGEGLNIISCPSCSRVENEAFVELAQKVREMTRYAAEHRITIAVMGCRVNGPGETDDADLGLWCGPRAVNLKRGSEKIGSFGYDEVLQRLREELDRLIAERSRCAR